MKKPTFPVKVFFNEDGSEWVLDSEDELANNLEWFDSEDPEENAVVTDANGEAVKLKVERLKIIYFELMDS